jgi:hypothetical protein
MHYCIIGRFRKNVKWMLSRRKSVSLKKIIGISISLSA